VRAHLSRSSSIDIHVDGCVSVVSHNTGDASISGISPRSLSARFPTRRDMLIDTRICSSVAAAAIIYLCA
jgi:hypothetical protein